MKLKEEITKKIKSDTNLRLDLREYLRISDNTVWRWLGDTRFFTKYPTLKFLAERLNYDNVEDLLEIENK